MPAMSGFQKLCIVACAVIFALIIVGGVVRATHSGEGCPDWPTCHGRFIPRTDKHTLIEYSHRATATVAGLLVLGVVIGAWRGYRRVPAVLYPATAAFVLLVFQAGLGGAVVENDLPAGIVALHLVLALTIFSLLVLVTMTTFAVASPLQRPAVSRSFGRVAAAASVATLALMVAGTYVAGAGYGLACSGWPLCNGQVVPSAHAASVEVIFLHRLLAAVVGLLIVALVAMSWRQRRAAPLAFNLSLAALAVYVAQAVVGAANVWTQLADEVSAAHLGVATLMWLLLAVLNMRVHGLYELLPFTSPARQRADLAGAPR